MKSAPNKMLEATPVRIVKDKRGLFIPVDVRTQVISELPMEPKAQALLNELKKVFEGDVKYRFENELHKFRLESDGPSQWLYVAREFVDDHTLPELLASLSSWQILEAFRSSPQNRWLYLGEAGIREVNDSFGRGH